MSRTHGSGTRGINLAPKSVLYEGRFGRLFRSLPAADFGTTDEESEANLALLASKLIAKPDSVKDGLDDEESGIPSAFTYFGQFVDHDLTFDPVSSLQKQNDPDALVNFRTPAFDLDCIYGRGPNDQPYLYEADGKSFALGTKMTGTGHAAFDLPRATSAQRALIGDPRNDENVIVSQLQGLLHRFHNRVIKEQNVSFEQAQQLVRFHYQWVIVHDFLPKIISARVLHRILPHLKHHNSDVVAHPPELRFFHAKISAFMPLEFSAAAYRLGHSMVRPGYRLNDVVLQPIFPFAGSGGDGNPDLFPGLTGFGKFPEGWAIDWARLIDLDGRPEDGPKRLQLAYRLDGSLVNPLGFLPKPVTDDKPPLNSLAARNLIRSWRMRLPSGQAIARAIGVDPIAEDQLLLGKEQDEASSDNPRTPVVSVHSVFTDNCPLWVYILLEAAHEYRTHPTMLTVNLEKGKTRKVGTPQLGDVGGLIVGETFAGILLEDNNSYWNLHPKFKPFLHGDTNKTFGLRELIRYALADGIA